MSRTVELASDQPAVPGQNGVRLRGARHVHQFLPAESSPDLGERAALRIGEPQSGRQVRSEDAVLGRGRLNVLALRARVRRRDESILDSYRKCYGEPEVLLWSGRPDRCTVKVPGGLAFSEFRGYQARRASPTVGTKRWPLSFSWSPRAARRSLPAARGNVQTRELLPIEFGRPPVCALQQVLRKKRSPRTGTAI